DRAHPRIRRTFDVRYGLRQSCDTVAEPRDRINRKPQFRGGLSVDLDARTHDVWSVRNEQPSGSLTSDFGNRKTVRDRKRFGQPRTFGRRLPRLFNDLKRDGWSARERLRSVRWKHSDERYSQLRVWLYDQPVGLERQRREKLLSLIPRFAFEESDRFALGFQN